MLRWLFLALWLGLLTDLFVFSPPPIDDQGTWVLEALTGQWSDKNPLTVAVFNLLGVWPLFFAARLKSELRGRPVPAWPFVLGSMALGAFALLPYFILIPRRPEPRDPWAWLKWIDHPITLGLLGVGAAVLAGWGLMYGDYAGFWLAVQSEQLVQVMSLDFAVLIVTMALTGARQ